MKKDLQFKEKRDNPWNEYTLDNDYVLMLKPTITQVDRTGNHDLRDIPLYDTISNHSKNKNLI
jgi:hypothetical protein